MKEEERAPKLGERFTTALAHTLAIKGVSAGERFTKPLVGVVRRGSPEIRANIEAAQRSVEEEIATTMEKTAEEAEAELTGTFPEAKRIIDQLSPEKLGASSPIAPMAAVTALLGLKPKLWLAQAVAESSGTAIEAGSLGQFEKPYDLFKSLLGAMGVYWLLDNVVRKPLEWSLLKPFDYGLASMFTPVIPGLRYLMDARSRWILAPEDLPKWLKHHGINPDAVYGEGQEWPTIETLWAFPFEPERWVWERINTWGQMFERLSQAPAGYFLLSMASRSGFFIEDIYRRALEDSDYGPLPMAIALAAFRKAFLRRHLTKYEDDAIEDYLKGDITLDQFKDRLRALEYSEDMVEIISGFYEDRQYRARRRVTLTMIKKSLQAGRIDRGKFVHELRRLGYPKEHIPFIVEETLAEIAPDRELTKAEILSAYRGKFRTRDWARERLLRIYADPEDVELLLDMNAPKED